MNSTWWRTLKMRFPNACIRLQWKWTKLNVGFSLHTVKMTHYCKLYKYCRHSACLSILQSIVVRKINSSVVWVVWVSILMSVVPSARGSNCLANFSAYSSMSGRNPVRMRVLNDGFSIRRTRFHATPAGWMKKMLCHQLSMFIEFVITHRIRLISFINNINMHECILLTKSIHCT